MIKRALCGIAATATIAVLASCTPSSLVDVPVPSSLVPAGSIATPAGAQQMYAFSVSQFAIAFGGGDGTNVGVDSYVSASGLLTDELKRTGTLLVSPIVPAIQLTIDERTMNSNQPTGSAGLYDQLQRARIEAQQAREALVKYAPASPKALQAQLFAHEGYTLVMFAELFCSGIPLSTVPINGDPIPSRGYSTDELFTIAGALFDSAMTLGADSARFVNLAKVGKARALMGGGPANFTAAAALAATVPTDFIYNAEFSAGVPRGANWIASNPWIYQAAGGEGLNGPGWINDPRTGVPRGRGVYGVGLPAKYSRNAAGALDPSVPWPNNPIPLASGVEARLIQAEWELSGGAISAWLAALNNLRSTCVASAACAPVPGILASQLLPLQDPGVLADPYARLKLMMNERAMWLFLTGHREGDMRRMVRWYSNAFDINSVWPIGEYINAGTTNAYSATNTNNTSYGPDVVLLPNPNERLTNSLYQGCLNVAP